jgi:pyruvate kinase
LRRAKIVCTIGPSSRSETVLKGLIDAGMDVARVNFSHGTRDEHRAVFDTIRSLSDSVAIMQDLRGPKIRIGEIAGGEMHLADGEMLKLTPRDVPGEAGLIHVTYPELPQDVSPGDGIYMADGTIHLEVERIEGDEVHCRVVHGGILASRKGVNLPGVKISAPALTAEDRSDIAFGLELGMDYVALSFVRCAGEVEEVKRLIREAGSTARVVAKIEKREALRELEAIIDAADALMIARGDLGVEIAPEEVPVVQKSIVMECLKRGKPVITATQMLESMTSSERPTRAEASDVANAVIDGTDAVMLSAETAIGAYPVETVHMMRRIIERTERYVGVVCDTGVADSRYQPRGLQYARPDGWSEADILTDAVCAGSVTVAEEIEASAIACLTHTGATARLMASHRPGVPVLALTDSLAAARHMVLFWGVTAVLVDRIEETEKVFATVREKVRGTGHRGHVVLTAGIPTREKQSTNTIHLLHVE